MKIRKQKPTCPACDSKQILTSKLGIRRCRVCGFNWKVDNETNKNK